MAGPLSMRRGRRSLLMLMVPAAAGCALAAEPQKGKASMVQIPLLQTLERQGAGAQATVNGFPADWLLTVRAGADRRAAGLATPMVSYAAIHPYFLRRGANEVTVQPRGSGTAALRVAAMDYAAEQDLGTVFAERELLRLAPGTPRGSFAWPDVPAWAWVQAPAIADTPENRQALQAAVRRFRDELDGLAGKPVPAGRAQALKASIREFVQASELRGRRYTLADDLLQIASTLMLPGDETPEAFLKKLDAQRQARQGQPARDDERGAHPTVARRADGSLPPRLSLRKLDGELRMQLFAGGRLARLTDAQGQPVIQFVSNYADGPRGSPNPVRFVCDPWFRKNAAQQWELDAIYPTQAARQVLDNPWPQEVLEQQPY